MLKAFTQHPRSVGERYCEHLGQAYSVAGSVARCPLSGFQPMVMRFGRISVQSHSTRS